MNIRTNIISKADNINKGSKASTLNSNLTVL